MTNTTHFPPGRLTDGELLARVDRLARHEQDTTALLVVHLAELDERRLHITHGYSSLFSYCTRELRLTEDAAFARIRAARAGRRFPLVFERMMSGALGLTAVRLLAPHLTESNSHDVLDRAEGLGLHELRKLVAELSPRPDVPASVRRAPVAASAVNLELGKVEPATQSEVQAPPVIAAPAVPAKIEPLAPRRYHVHFTASEEMHSRLQAARALLRHRFPDGDIAAILDAGLVALLEKTEKRKLARTDYPRRPQKASAAPEPQGEVTADVAVVANATKPGVDEGTRTAPTNRHIPSHIRREVWTREGGRCGYRSPGGRRCDEQSGLEFHHLEPFAIGGATSADNLALRCRAHNRLEAERTLGHRVMARALAVRGRPPGG